MNMQTSDALLELWASSVQGDPKVQTAKFIRKLVRASSDEEALLKIGQLDVLDLSVDPWMRRDWPLDLSVLQLLPRVQGVKLNGSQYLSLVPLTHLKTLKSLFLDELELVDIGWLSELQGIEVFSARRNKLRTVEVLSQLPALREVNVAENSLTTLSPFSNLEKIRILDVSQNMIADLSPVSKRKSLRVLRLRRNALNSLEGLEDLRDLDELDVRDNRILSLRPIKDLGMLNTLGIAGNPLTEDDIDTLRRSIRFLT
jgi:internalin A